MKDRTHWRPTILVAAMVLLATACGGDDDITGAEGTVAATSATEGDTAADTTEADSVSPDDGIAEGTAVIDVAGNRYDITIDRCFSMVGAIGGFGFATSNPDITMEFDFPPPDYESRADAADWEPPSIRVDDEVSGTDWRSGGSDLQTLNLPGIDVEAIVVGAWEADVDGRHATGTGTFIDLNAALTGDASPVDGSFEFNCAE